jgi:hypothetical protein
VALSSIAALVVVVLPMRSAIRPAAAEPARPATPIVKNAIVPVSVMPGAVPVECARAAV